jgi:hypothetical protein
LPLQTNRTCMAGTVGGAGPGEKACVTEINRHGHKFMSESRVAHATFSSRLPSVKIAGNCSYPELSG